jgi:hypothetical protein
LETEHLELHLVRVLALGQRELGVEVMLKVLDLLDRGQQGSVDGLLGSLALSAGDGLLRGGDEGRGRKRHILGDGESLEV